MPSFEDDHDDAGSIEVEMVEAYGQSEIRTSSPNGLLMLLRSPLDFLMKFIIIGTSRSWLMLSVAYLSTH